MAARSVMASGPGGGSDSEPEEMAGPEIWATKVRRTRTTSHPGHPETRLHRVVSHPGYSREDSPPVEGRSDTELYRQLGASLCAGEHELSAPYEVPQFPIEQIESKIRRVKEGQGAGTAHAHGGEDDTEDEMDASTFLTEDFQRVNISGEDSSGVPVEDLHSAAQLLSRALNTRERWRRATPPPHPPSPGT